MTPPAPRDPAAYDDALGFVLLARRVDGLRDEGRLDARTAKDARDRFLRLAMRAAGEGAARDPEGARERALEAARLVTALPRAIREALGVEPDAPAGGGPRGDAAGLADGRAAERAPRGANVESGLGARPASEDAEAEEVTFAPADAEEADPDESVGERGSDGEREDEREGEGERQREDEREGKGEGERQREGEREREGERARRGDERGRGRPPRLRPRPDRQGPAASAAARAERGPPPTARSSLVLGFVVGGLAIVGGSIPLARLVWQSGDPGLQYGAFVCVALLLYGLGLVCGSARVYLPLAASTFYAVFALLAPLVLSAAGALEVGLPTGFAGALVLAPLAYFAMRHLLDGETAGGGRAAGLAVAALATFQLALDAPALGGAADHIPALAAVALALAAGWELRAGLDRVGAGAASLVLLWPGAAAWVLAIRAVDLYAIEAAHLATPLLLAGMPGLAVGIALASRPRAAGRRPEAGDADGKSEGEGDAEDGGEGRRARPDGGAGGTAGTAGAGTLLAIGGGGLVLAAVALSLTAPWGALSTGLTALLLSVALHLRAPQPIGPALAIAASGLLLTYGYARLDAHALEPWQVCRRLEVAAAGIALVAGLVRWRSPARVALPIAIAAALAASAAAIGFAPRDVAWEERLLVAAAVFLAGGAAAGNAALTWQGGAWLAPAVLVAATGWGGLGEVAGGRSVLALAAALVVVGAWPCRLGRPFARALAGSWWVAGWLGLLAAGWPLRPGSEVALALLFVARAVQAAREQAHLHPAGAAIGPAAPEPALAAVRRAGGIACALVLFSLAAAEVFDPPRLHALGGIEDRRLWGPLALVGWAGGAAALTASALASAAALAARRVAWLGGIARSALLVATVLLALVALRALAIYAPGVEGVREAALRLGAAALGLVAVGAAARSPGAAVAGVVAATLAVLSLARLGEGLDGLREAPHAGWLAAASLGWLALAGSGERLAARLAAAAGAANERGSAAAAFARGLAAPLRALAPAPLAWATVLVLAPVAAELGRTRAIDLTRLAEPALASALLVTAAGLWLALPSFGLRRAACAAQGSCLVGTLAFSAAALALAARLALENGLDRPTALGVAGIVAALAVGLLGRSAIAHQDPVARAAAVLHALACGAACAWALASGAASAGPGAAAALGSAASATGALALAALAIALFALAARAERERPAYAGLAALAGLALFLRLGRPDLFATGFFAAHWPVIFALIAWALAGVADLCRRLGVPVLARPLVRAGYALALLPVGGAFAVERGVGSLALFVGAGFFALVAARERRFGAAALAGLLANLGLHPLLLAGGFRYGPHPELFFGPLGLSMLAAAHFARGLPRAERDAIGTGGAVIALASLLLAVYVDQQHRVAESIALAGLAGLGAMFGTLVRVRAYVHASLAFLAVDVASHVYWAGQDHPWVWWTSLVVLGLALVAFFALLERRRAAPPPPAPE